LSGEVAVLAQIEKELVSSRMNDGKCDPIGRFWCGSMSEEPSKGNLWMLDLDNQLHHKVENVSCSNGLVWTDDGKTMYYIDTPTGTLDAFDYDLDTGAIKNRREVLRNQWGGYFDGMTIDEDDNLYIAIWGGGAVYKIDPLKKRLLQKITLPGVKNVTSCAFGGENLSDLYITSSSLGTNPKDEPNAGALFRVALKDAKGRPAFKYLG
jgi:sugar lactone lactonase YvrE